MAGFPKAGDQYGGRYRIVSEVGHGGMGVVYEALDTVLNRPVALKIVLPSLSDRDEYHERFALEAAALARIQSRHIVGIYDYGEHDDTVFFATQFFPDGDLKSWLEEHGPLPRRDALALVAQVVEALADAHAAGVVHRDVKPSNVLLWARPDGLVPYLADFGIAVEGELSKRSGITRTGTLIGSPAYMAPERHFGHPADERGDIYAAGCLLWTALTGEAPYSGTDFQMMNAHINAPVVSLGTGDPVDDRIDEVLAEAMEKDPDRRIASAAELQARLGAIVRDLDTGVLLARPQPAAPPVPPIVVPEPIGQEGPPSAPEDDAPAEPTPVAPAARESAPEPVGTPAPASPAPPSPVPAAASAAGTPGVSRPVPVETGGRGRRRRRLAPVLAGAAAVVAVAVAATAIVALGDDADPPGASDEPTPTGSASPTVDPLPEPDPPRVRASAGYRQVTFAFPQLPATAPDAPTVEVDTGEGWTPQETPRLAVPTKQGGDRECLRARTVRTDGEQTATSPVVRQCGRAKPRTISVTLDQSRPCSVTSGGFTFPCWWHGLQLSGFAPNSRHEVRMHEVGQPDNCPTEASCQRIRVDASGRLQRPDLIRVIEDLGTWVVSVDGVSTRVDLRGPYVS